MQVLGKFSTSQKWGAVLLIALLAFAFGEWAFGAGDIATQNLGNILQAPTAQHPFGTDHFGRDMLSRVASAVRLSFLMASLSVLIALIFGIIAGIGASVSRVADKLLGFLCDIIMALPGLLFILLFSAIAPNSFWALYLGISLVAWVEFFKVSRAISQSLAKSPEVESSRLMGMGFFYLIKRHFLPRLMPVVLTLAGFACANAVLALATLGFINVGLRPPTAELGLMMTELFPHYYNAPWIFIQPMIAVVWLTLSFQLLAGQEKA